MKKWICLWTLILTVTTGLYSQGEPVLMTIGDEQVTVDEFERIYKKNNNESSLNRQTPEEYLELFINFKLKVKEAEALGMDTTAKFRNELEGYREQLAKPYLSDNETREEMMREAYERAKLDIKASHILIKLPPHPTPEDTLAAYEKIMEIRDRIMNGEDFETVARATSDDASVSRNGGNLNYFTVFSMIYSFETVAYNTPVNSVSMPFRSDYGYHIMKVHDRRPARGQVKVAHIFVRTPQEMSGTEKEKAYEKIQTVYDSLRLGEDFSEMARKYSEDPASARNGGEMPWFGTGRMIPEFEDACFSLEEKGSFTKPFKSFYGWHIVKLLDKKGIGTYEQMKPELQEKVDRGDRGQYKTEKYVAGLKKEYGYSEYPEALGKVLNAADTSLFSATWKAGSLEQDQTPLMKIGDHTGTVGQFAVYLESNQNGRGGGDPGAYARELFEQFVREEIIDYEESRLPEKHPEFRYIYEEYHDGILLFDIMDQKVWSRAVSDTAGLIEFHQDHKTDYMWDERTDAVVVSCSEGVDVEKVRKRYKKILRGRWDQEKLNDKFCDQDTVDCITLTHLLVEEGENEKVDALNRKVGPGPVYEEDGREHFILIREVRPPEPKALNEARGQITSDYQDYLEKQWIAELKEKYPVQVNRSLLSGITP
ncbi:MAG: peptidylprolyl isomerase [Bacteroidales bacterium]